MNVKVYLLHAKDNMISKALAGAAAKPIILSILNGSEAYGYQIIKHIQKLSGGTVLWNDGTLYPFLHRLEGQGLVSSAWRLSDVGRRRKYYQITKKGRREMDRERIQWLAVDSILAQLWVLTPRPA